MPFPAVLIRALHPLVHFLSLLDAGVLLMRERHKRKTSICACFETLID